MKFILFLIKKSYFLIVISSNIYIFNEIPLLKINKFIVKWYLIQSANLLIFN